jgi:F-type H+-transporting ATPase subunit gamma
MPSLKEVKNRISSVVSTQQITKAMKMVSAAKLRRAQDRIIQMRPYASKLEAILRNLSQAQSNSDGDKWYSRESRDEKILIIAVSSDRGLCGSFNSAVCRGVLKLVDDNYREQHRKGNVLILPIGKKAAEYFTKRKFEQISQYSTLFSELNFETASQVAETAMEKFRSGGFDKVILIYNEFKNIATQVLRQEQLLPIQLPESDGTSKSAPIDYIYQPDQEEIITKLIPNSLKVQVFKSLLDSNAAEHGARMTAMDKATENAGELLKELRLSYNRSRQAAITKEILEIVGGAEALKSS